MLRGAGGDPSGDALDSLANELLEVPACAVGCQHGQVVEMDRGLLVELRDLIVIDLIQPVVRGDRSGVGEDQSAQRILDGGVLLHSPVEPVEVAVYQLGIVEHACRRLTDALALAAVQDVRLGDAEIP